MATPKLVLYDLGPQGCPGRQGRRERQGGRENPIARRAPRDTHLVDRIRLNDGQLCLHRMLHVYVSCTAIYKGIDSLPRIKTHLLVAFALVF